ncbi:MAG TPA: hypothetical protein VMC85_05090 [Desulfomonilaceae bacterium]|nr:hypothetical protein [Desulfomonilaceae bacterium]
MYGSGVELVAINVFVDGLDYEVELIRKVSLPPDAPRLVVVSRQENPTATELVRLCIRAVQHFTSEPHELWIVDNNSPMKNLKWLIDWPDVNVALNRTEPIPAEGRGPIDDRVDSSSQLVWDSYANAIALELGVRLVHPDSRYLMSMHMDALPCRAGWLSYLRSKVKGRVAAAGVRMDRTRTPDGVLHVLGYMVDFQLFKKLALNFLPDLPNLDVGDRVTLALRDAGYEVFACHNTLWEPHLAANIPASSPLSQFHIDRSFDDDGDVIFLHLGRGVRKSLGVHRKGTTADEWIKMVSEHLLV